MDDEFGIVELHEFELAYKFYVNDQLEPVFYDISDAKHFIRDVLKVRHPEYVYRCVRAYDSDGYQIVVIYVAKPYKIFLKE